MTDAGAGFGGSGALPPSTGLAKRSVFLVLRGLVHPAFPAECCGAIAAERH
jgi:hypothetical protein